MRACRAPSCFSHDVSLGFLVDAPPLPQDTSVPVLHVLPVHMAGYWPIAAWLPAVAPRGVLARGMVSFVSDDGRQREEEEEECAQL